MGFARRAGQLIITTSSCRIRAQRRRYRHVRSNIAGSRHGCHMPVVRTVKALIIRVAACAPHEPCCRQSVSQMMAALSNLSKLH
jgi:hypothetical protein